ncbi:MAG: hypothetical protein KJO98_12920 [Rhodothermia bacterium]|nr:hypothetical protein [Rhodothermia bacterium]
MRSVLAAERENSKSLQQHDRARFPWWATVGIVLVALGWTANWYLPGARTHIFFAPLWVGFALTVDGIVLRRTGTSIISRSWRQFFVLFALSVPAWWLFELINLRTQNWIYVGRELFTDLEFFVLSTVAFSTVIPAVFEAAELVSSFRWTERLQRGPTLTPSSSTRAILAAAGVASLLLVVTWPRVFYPLVWGIPFFLIEPLNQQLGRSSLFNYLGRGNWRPVISLALGALLCGLFWEFWNFYSYPKWIYDTPGVNWAHVFEMPVLGYIGYLPFGLALYAMASLMHGRAVQHFDVGRNVVAPPSRQ